MKLVIGQPDHTRIPYHNARRWEVLDQNPAKPTVQVFMTQKVYLQINAHAQSDIDNEVGGWLLGRLCWDSTNLEEFIVVDQTLIAPHTNNSSTHLTFTQDSQVEMLRMQEEYYPEKIVLGWYHSHPRMSIFLSSYDLWLHDNFFPHPWQVALVVEPHNHLGGIFIRDDEHQLNPRRYYGFYELKNAQEESVADWSNIRHGDTAPHDLEDHDDPN